MRQVNLPSTVERRLANAPPVRYIRASEINTYLFCHRVWHLDRRGAASSLIKERAAGAAFHHAHGDRVTTAQKARPAAPWFAVLGFVLLGIFILLVI